MRHIYCATNANRWGQVAVLELESMSRMVRPRFRLCHWNRPSKRSSCYGILCSSLLKMFAPRLVAGVADANEVRSPTQSGSGSLPRPWFCQQFAHYINCLPSHYLSFLLQHHLTIAPLPPSSSSASLCQIGTRSEHHYFASPSTLATEGLLFITPWHRQSSSSLPRNT